MDAIFGDISRMDALVGLNLLKESTGSTSFMGSKLLKESAASMASTEDHPVAKPTLWICGFSCTSVSL